MLAHRLAPPLRRRWRAELVRRAVPSPPQDDLRPCLVVSPHPDDEVLGCGSSILRRTTRDTPVTVLQVSLGERSHPAVPPRELAEVRRAEAGAAADALGVRDLRFLELPDGRLSEHHEELVAAVAALLVELGPSDVLCPAVGEAHPDHTAVAHAVRQAVGDSGSDARLLDYYVWYWSVWPWRDAGRAPRRVLSAIRQELSRPVLAVDGLPVRGRKLAALAAYASQTGGPEPRGNGSDALPPELLARAADRHELLGLALLRPDLAGAGPAR